MILKQAGTKVDRISSSSQIGICCQGLGLQGIGSEFKTVHKQRALPKPEQSYFKVNCDN